MLQCNYKFEASECETHYGMPGKTLPTAISPSSLGTEQLGFQS